jgi:hypothetical protein
MDRIEDGTSSSTAAYERQESVGPGNISSAGPERPPIDAYETARPLLSITLETFGATPEA